MIDVVESRGPVLLLRARGHINTQGAALFEANAMHSIADTDSHVVIEASEVTYLSSAGLRVFLRLWRELGKSDRAPFYLQSQTLHKPGIRTVGI